MNETEFTIEKNVEMPSKKMPIHSPLSITLRQMEIGDSILMNQRQRNAAFAIAHGIPIKLASRRAENATDQIRVWRIK